MMVSKVVALSVALILTAVIERPQPIAGAKLGQREAVRDWIVVREPKTSEESIAHCQSLGREMVYILTEEDAEYYSEITKDIDMTGSEHGYIRIGLQSPNKDCQWSWVGSSQPFEPGTWFWQGGEPNGCRRNELCAQNGRGGKRWNDSKCYYKTFFVCGNPAATCTDGLQNQGETGVDCGGPCDACQTCEDGIQNQGEDGIDCGGPCNPCQTCDDGIQNQGEDGIDCGGPCDACEDTSEVICQDTNALCKMEPAFLLDILCQIETVSQQCPKRCSSCSEIETTEAPITSTTTPEPIEYEYLGKRPRKCKNAENKHTLTCKLSDEYKDLESKYPGPKCKAACDSAPSCVAIGTHYHCDRLFFSDFETALTEVPADMCKSWEYKNAADNQIFCQDIDSNDCGSVEATNGCFVKRIKYD